MDITELAVLQQLQCISLPDKNGREPYIWPALIPIDIATPNGFPTIGVVPTEADNNGTSGYLLSSDMHDGDSADIPAFVGALGHGSNDTFPRRDLLLVVVLWEHHDFPQGAIDVGYNSFLSTLLCGVATNLPFLDDLSVLEGIAQNVQTAVTTAIKNALPLTFIGSQDILVGFGVQRFTNPPVAGTNPDFSLPIFTDPSGGPQSQYVINGQIQVSVDQCTAQEAAVTQAQLQVDTINAQLNVLLQEWQHASAGMRTYILKQRQKLNAELGAARARLDKAKQALAACKAQND